MLAAGMRKSQTSRWRAIALALVNLLMVAHIIHWWIAGRTISPIEPSEAMHTLQRGALNAGFIFFTLAILGTMIFGRFVCGWGCHILALQDGCAWLLKKIGITPKPFRSRLLIYVPLVAALYMFVWPTFYRAFLNPEPGPIIPAFTNHLVTDNFWATFPSVAVAIPFLFICGFVTVYFLGMKGFCTYACPYGGFFVLADKLAPGQDPRHRCLQPVRPLHRHLHLERARARRGEAIRHGRRSRLHEVHGLHQRLPERRALLRLRKTHGGGSRKHKAIPRNYSLTWPEEIFGLAVFLTSFLAVRGVYGLVPFLMALGCAAVSTFLALKTWRLITASEVYFHRFHLKIAGHFQTTGWAFLLGATLWLGVTAHSGWIRYHESRGSQAFGRLRIPDELALAQLNPARWLSPADRAHISAGEKHLRTAANYGLFQNSDALAKLAWLDYLRGDAETASVRLAQAATGQKDQAKALSLYYRGAILNRLRRFDEAQLALDQALVDRDDLILARQEKGESLWMRGRKEEAVAVWSEAVRRNPSLVLVNNQLAGAHRALGRRDSAAMHERQADHGTPNDPLYHWMLGQRLHHLGMTELSEKHFARARQLNPAFREP